MAIVYVHDVETRSCIASETFSCWWSSERWFWVQRTVAKEYGCRADEVILVEHESGEDHVTARGRTVAFLAT